MNLVRRVSLRSCLLVGAASVTVAGAQAAYAQPVEEGAPANDAARTDGDQSNDADVVITATKRATTLQETALAVSVLGEEEIDKRGLVGMDDYLAGLPGVSYQDRGTGSNTITIRGIGLGSQLEQNSPVGSYFGEVPVTGLGPEVNGNQAGNADIKLVDIARVEVLRGPQGTLYGSGSMGGTVRVIPNAPNLREAEGRVAAEYSNTGRGGGHNYSVEAAASVPLIEDRLAVRLVAFQFRNDGWIQNVAVSHPTPEVTAAVNAGALAEDRNHVGADKYTGFRGSVLWRPVDNLSVTLTHLYQRIEQDGFKDVLMTLPGKYQQSRVKVGEAGTDDEYVNIDLAVTNLVLEYDLGWGTILNSTSKLDSEASADVELSFFSTPFVGVASRNLNNKEIFVNEFRFVSDFRGPVQIIAGLYYEDRSAHHERVIRWAAPQPVPPGTFFYTDDITNTEKQTAVFGELAFNPWDPLTLTVGARYFKFKQAIERNRVLGVPTGSEGRRASVDGVNWKVNLSYEFTPELFAYGQWSQGFRSPRFQGIVLPEYDADGDGLVEFRDGIERKVTEGLLAPDSVDNYEIGIKYQSNDRRFQGALTGFIIDWSGIPISPSLTAYQGAAFYFNAGKARSTGVELEATLEPVEDLIFSLAASYVNSELSESSPGLGAKGADLPGSADYNLHAAVEKRFNMGGNEAFVRGDYTYVSEYFNSLTETGTPAGGYHLFDLSAGVAINNVKLGLFVKNLTNSAAFTWADNVFGLNRAYRLRPRTIGVNASVSF